MKVKSYLSALFSIFFISAIFSQGNVGINHFGFPPHPSAILDLSSFDQGFLMPRMESWVKWTIPNPTEGLMVCDTTTKSIWIFTNNNWEELAMKYNTHFTNDFGNIHNIGNIYNDNFVFGSTDINENGDAGMRKRFFFHKGKAAFRAGELYDVTNPPTPEDESKNWDVDSLGYGSVAIGRLAHAPALDAIAIGGNARARGSGSVAIGNTVLAKGGGAVALGVSSAIGARSFAVGSTNNANGYASSAMGELTVANGKFSTSSGERTLATALANVAIGKFNVGNGDPLNWVLTDPLFEIGNAPDLSSRQNAFTVLKDGTMISGSHQVNDDPSRTNDNKRMFFHKGKAAFRAGELYDITNPATPEDESKNWDVDSLGHGSVAIGRLAHAPALDAIAIGGNARARGSGSVAIGNTVYAKGGGAVALGISSAIGDRSFAVGSTNNAIGYASTSMGELTNAIGDFSFTIGRSTNASGQYSFAAGNGSASSNIGTTALGASYANGQYATAVGLSSHANGNYSFASGQSDALGEWSSALGLSSADGQWSTAGGNGNASAMQSTAFGTSNATSTAATAMGISTASGSYSTAMGLTKAESFGGVAVGFQNIGGGNPGAWVNTDPLFEVGNGTWTVPSNAFTVLKNGRVGINHSFPQTMLDIEQPNSGIGNGILLNLQGVGHWETMVSNNGAYNFHFNNNLRAYLTGNGILNLPQGLDVGLATDGNLVIGEVSGWNISIDNNEIMARNAGGVHDLLLQKDGGKVGIGPTAPSHQLTVESGNYQTMRLVGPNSFGYGARLNFGDGDLVYIDEPTDDNMEIHASSITLSGNVNITGSLSKGSGSFKIDHPLDPEHQFLYHSFVESPDMMNLYNGIVSLDESGEAKVSLPDWFEALNRDFRYQLTAIGSPGPNLFIAREIQNNAFMIAGGKPGMKVSWEVTGIRKDPYANKHRIPVEEEKPAFLKGTYLYPDVYGVSNTQPGSKKEKAAQEN
jgi:hypothetical protein